ncbi:MAG: hypothetical protein ABI947_11190 [Chloroflexota bacterium]
MGIRLDWEVDSERVSHRSGEDPDGRKQRRQQRLRLLFFTFGIMIALCAIGAVIWYRLYTVDEQLKRELIETVQAETANLRAGNFAQYIAIQRTAPGGSWFQDQIERFRRYQDLKTKSSVKLTGNVLSTEIDGSRGRAVVEEIIDGVTYETVWFYWRYNDGWRHVPSDFTFWGDQKDMTGKVSTISYSQLDAPLAQALASRVDKWWSDACGYLGCSQVPKLTVEITANEVDQVQWDSKKDNTLLVPSPLASGDRTRVDTILSDQMEDSIAAMLATRAFDLATSNLRPIPTADAAWLRQATIDWLTYTFVGRGDPVRVSFIQSLKDHYGTAGLVNVIHALTPSTDIGVVGVALKQPIELLALDWRMFFQWRLEVEKTLIARNDVAGFQALWDAANPAALEQMRERMAHPTQSTPQVQAVSISPGSDGVSRATVQTTADGQSVVIIFRLVEGGWKRSI